MHRITADEHVPTATTHEGASASPSARLCALIEQLKAVGDELSPVSAAEILGPAPLTLSDLLPYVEERPESYARRSVARTDVFELLVLTWRPGQRSAAHDHAGSSCCLRVMTGRALETSFAVGTDGMALASTERQLGEGALLVDSGQIVHRLENPAAARELLVSLHVYVPPLPELRRYAVAPPSSRLAAAFARSPTTGTPTVAIVGAGFSGTMTTAQLMLLASHAAGRLHLVLFEKHSSLGEGAAYRTPNEAHLLNVPAGRMTAWPGAASDFLEWAQTRRKGVTAGEFLPRNWYADYLRTQLFAVAEAAHEGVSAELVRDEVVGIARRPHGNGFALTTSTGRLFHADGVVLATGHRRPSDPFARRYVGSKSRYITDPWASLVLGSVQADEPVLVVGTGLTAIDVFLTLRQSGRRTAPVYTLSRRGLLPATHTEPPAPAVDAGAWVAAIAGFPERITARGLLGAVRRAVSEGEARGVPWQAVIDGIRPYTTALWSALPEREARRFLRHIRTFWEVHRHRMAPSIGAQISQAVERDELRVLAGHVVSSEGDLDGITVRFKPRGSATTQTLRVAWVVNCTGPGDIRGSTDRVLQSLMEEGALRPDDLGLGARTGPQGQAHDREGREQPDLVVVGTLRKADLWESTAVPELRAQAVDAARVLWGHLCEETAKNQLPPGK